MFSPIEKNRQFAPFRTCSTVFRTNLDSVSLDEPTMENVAGGTKKTSTQIPDNNYQTDARSSFLWRVGWIQYDGTPFGKPMEPSYIISQHRNILLWKMTFSEPYMDSNVNKVSFLNESAIIPPPTKEDQLWFAHRSIR